MSLRSQLFAGDAKLEAAATSDTAHVAPGASGDHVRKIQAALCQLAGAQLSTDGQYGPRTAAAVLAFKQKRDIVNRAYQSSADDIVGKMTVVAMDAELSANDAPAGPPEITVLAPRPALDRHLPLVSIRLANNGNPVISSMAGGKPNINPGPIIELKPGQIAKIVITNGGGGTISSSDPSIASIRKPGDRSAPLTRLSSDPENVEIVANAWGSVVIIVNNKPGPSLSLPDAMFMTSITIKVKALHRTPYVPTMVPHNHRPVRDWPGMLDKIRQPHEHFSGKALALLCAVHADPMTFVNAAIAGEFRDKPVALRHLNWYLRDGRGQDFKEDQSIAQWVRVDWGLRKRLSTFVRENVNAGRTPRHHGWLLFENGMYAKEAEDYLYAFGTIDRLDVEYDMAAKTVKIWFKDSYEWHPVCEGCYTKFADDEVRVTNSLHAALVQMKDRGAADYWMLGEATFPMSQLEFLWPRF